MSANGVELNFFLKILAPIVSAIIIGISTYIFKNRKNLSDIFHGIMKHKKELEDKIRKMPFIYKDIHLDLLKDFVELEMLTFEGPLLKIADNRKRIDITNRIKTNRKMLIVGSAGIGKTTFLRYNALLLCENKSPLCFNINEKLIPVYVPLKAVDNSIDQPILHYILSNNKYFNNKRGLKRLYNLAKSNRLLLLLDGYDEISLTTNTNNIATEIGYLVDKNRITQYDNQYMTRNIFKYNMFENTRVWVTTRREFFLNNPIDVFINQKIRSSIASSVKICGVSIREKLIDTIFNKYRTANNFYIELLSTERMIRTIDQSDGLEIKELSYNALFLTVMCYIYVKNIEHNKSNKFNWSHGLIEIVNQCIELLVYDLDEYKVRDLTEANKAAYLDRRNSHHKAKLSFLPYFAWQLYRDQVQVFNLNDLHRYANNWLRGEGASFDDVDLIVRQINDDSTDDICIQLINSGIFIFVDKVKNINMFDFPHRRFKEVLAVTYLNNTGKIDELANQVEIEELGELILVAFSVSNLRDPIMNAVVQSIKISPKRRYCSKLLMTCLEKAPSSYRPQELINDLVNYCLSNNIDPGLYYNFFETFRLPKDAIDKANKCFKLTFQKYSEFIEWHNFKQTIRDLESYIKFVKDNSIYNWNKFNKEVNSFKDLENWKQTVKEDYLPLSYNEKEAISWKNIKTDKEVRILLSQIKSDYSDWKDKIDAVERGGDKDFNSVPPFELSTMIMLANSKNTTTELIQKLKDLTPRSKRKSNIWETISLLSD